MNEFNTTKELNNKRIQNKNFDFFLLMFIFINYAKKTKYKNVKNLIERKK